MAKNTRYLDAQGRIIIPPHIRKALNLGTGSVVTVDMADNGDVIIRATEERCCVCGASVHGKHYTELMGGSGKKLVCFECAQSIARSMMK